MARRRSSSGGAGFGVLVLAATDGVASLFPSGSGARTCAGGRWHATPVQRLRKHIDKLPTKPIVGFTAGSA